MTQTAEVLARGPVSDTLREAARRGLGLQLETLPSSAAFLYEAIYNSLFSRQIVQEPHRCRIALDTTITLCAEHAGKRLVPTTVHRVERVIASCFTLYDLPRWCVTHALNMLASVCRGGIPVPSLKDLARQVRGERILRAHDDGADYPLACCHDLTPGAFAGSSASAEPHAATDPSTGKEITVALLNVHTIPAGCSHAGIHGASRHSWNPRSAASFPGECHSVSAYASRTRVGVRGCVRTLYGSVRFWDGPHRPRKDTPAGPRRIEPWKKRTCASWRRPVS